MTAAGIRGGGVVPRGSSRAGGRGDADRGNRDRCDPRDDTRPEVPFAQPGDADRVLDLLERLGAEQQNRAADAVLELAACGAALQMRVEQRILELRDLVVQAQRHPCSGTVAVLRHRPECHIR
jgi:hypothetical protein